jgi:hypothetical protein
MTRIVIGNSDSEQVSIQIVGRADVEGWSFAHVEVACGVWRGGFDCEFAADELYQFGREIERLYRSLDGTADLSPIEPKLELRLTGDGKGHIAVFGKAVAQFQTQTYLTFEFSLDQTQLPVIAAALLQTKSRA